MIRAVAFLAALLAAPAAAQSVAEQAAAAAAQLEMASVRLEQAQGASDRLQALTETVQSYEEGLSSLRDGLRQAAIRQQALETDLAGREEEIARLLGVLQTLDRTPEPLLLLHPSGPTGSARAGMVLADVTPALQTEAEALKNQLEEIAALTAIQASALSTLQDGLEGAEAARGALAQAASDRAPLPRRFVEDKVQTALLLASTETLAAFASGLEQTEGAAGTATAPESTAQKGQVPLPLRGTLLRAMNEADAAGVRRQGVLIAAPPGALVTAPVASTLRYRGPLLDLGQVVLLEPATNVLIVLAGMSEVFGEAGEVLPAGTPIGLMGGDAGTADGILTSSSLRRDETLYIEVREGGSPVDPATWFAIQ